MNWYERFQGEIKIKNERLILSARSHCCQNLKFVDFTLPSHRGSKKYLLKSVLHVYL